MSLAGLELFHPIIQRFHFRIDSAQSSGMGSLAHFDRRCPFMELSQQSGFSSFDPRRYALLAGGDLRGDLVCDPLLIFFAKYTKILP